jgi:hypothetical protein
MIIADYLKLTGTQKPIYDCNTAFVIAFILTKIDFQLYGAIFLGQIKVYQLLPYGLNRIFIQKKTLYIIALIPAFFITSVLGSFSFMILQYGLDIVTSDIIEL